MTTITNKGRELFHAIYADIDLPYEQWDDIMQTLSLLSRHAVTHRKLAEYACNGDPIRSMYGRMDSVTIDHIAQQREEEAEKRDQRIEARIKALAATLPNVSLELQGDPRGSTVYLIAHCDDGIDRTHYAN